MMNGCQNGDTPFKFRPLRMTPSKRTPKTVPLIVPTPPPSRGTADDGRGDGLELQPYSSARERAPGSSQQQQPGKPSEGSRYGVAENDDPPHGNARQRGGTFTATDRINIVSKPHFAEDEPAEHDRADEKTCRRSEIRASGPRLFP